MFCGKRYCVHRIIWEMHNGPIPEGYQIDHIDIIALIIGLITFE
ncbi:HNH endonuclease signature motif containing protein [Escherichia coli]